MRRTVMFFSILLVSLCLVAQVGVAQQKLAQTGMKFLNVATDGRAVALGEAMTSLDGESSSMFFNPASMARQASLGSVNLGQVEWIADIRHQFASASFSPFEGEYGVIGLMLQSVDYGVLEQTIRSSNDQGYLDLGTFKPTAIMVGVGYARGLSDKFAVGGIAKWVHQNLGSGVVGVSSSGDAYDFSNNVADVFAFDFGITYKTGFRSLQFGMVVRNFSKEARYIDEGFQLPLTFRIGVSMNAFDFIPVDQDMHQLLVSIDAEHPRDYPERMKMGVEYLFMKIIALRAGFISLAEEQKFSYGIGLQKSLGTFGVGVDYAYTPFGVFDKVQTFNIRVSF
jgi:hypothetical protein